MRSELEVMTAVADGFGDFAAIGFWIIGRFEEGSE